MRPLPFTYAARHLGRTPSRLVVMVTGAALVVLLLLVAGGFVRGMDQALRGTGGAQNVILMGAGSEESVERSEVDASVAGVIAAALPGIRTRAGVAFVSPEVHLMLPVGGGEARHAEDTQQVASDEHQGEGSRLGTGRQVMLRGVTPAAALVHDAVSIVEGRWPRRGAEEVMAGRMAGAALGLSHAEIGVGRTLEIDGRRWTIVGHFAAPGTAVEAELWLPLEDLMIAARRDSLSCVVVALDPWNEATGEGAEFDDVAAFIKLRPDLELVAMRERGYYERLAGFFAPIRVVVWVTAGLIALGGVFGGLNTMHAAFASRVREYGTLEAIGFGRWAIAWSMLQESTLATATGSLIACAIGLLLLDGVAVRFSMGAFGLMIDEHVVGLGLLCGLALGVVGTIPPALRLLRPPIAEALKAV